MGSTPGMKAPDRRMTWPDFGRAKITIYSPFSAGPTCFFFRVTEDVENSIESNYACSSIFLGLVHLRNTIRFPYLLLPRGQTPLSEQEKMYSLFKLELNTWLLKNLKENWRRSISLISPAPRKDWMVAVYYKVLAVPTILLCFLESHSMKVSSGDYKIANCPSWNRSRRVK